MMLIKTSVFTSVLIVSLLCNIFLITFQPSFTKTLQIPNTYTITVLAFKANLTKTATNHSPIAENMNITNKDNLPLAFLLKGSDQDGDKLTFSIVNNPARGVIVNFDQSTGSGIYQKSYGTEGDVFTYKVADSKGAVSNIAQVTIIFT